jgi:hypothetical protein
VGFKHSTGCTLQVPLNLLVQAAQLHPEVPVSLWVMGEPGLAPDHRIFRKDAGDAQVSPLHHACLFPCHLMSFICSFTLSRRALTEFVTLCGGARAKRGAAAQVGLDIQVQLPESIHSQSTPDTCAVQERRQLRQE